MHAETTTTLRALLFPGRLGSLQKLFEAVVIPALWVASFVTLIVVAVWY